MTNEYVDEKTGEVLDETSIDAPVEQRKTVYIPGGKVLVSTTNLARLGLTGLEFRTLFAMAAQITQGAGSLTHCTVNSIAEALEKNPRGIEKIFASLRRKGIIERVANGHWAINPRLLYRGSFAAWAQEYPQAPDPSYETNSNGLDGKKMPYDYNRTFRAPTQEQP